MAQNKSNKSSKDKKKKYVPKSDEKVTVETHDRNHPEWYAKYPLDTLINLNYGLRKSLTNRVHTMRDTENDSSFTWFDKTSTSAALYTWLTVPKDDNNSFNQAMATLYAEVRAANSGRRNYDVWDLSAYLLNVRSIIAAMTQLRRTIGLANYTNAYDADLPSVLTSMSSGGRHYNTSGNSFGTTFETISDNRANLINFYNTQARLLKNLLPYNAYILDRTEWLFGNVFADSNDVKANYYQFVLSEVPKYTATTDSDLRYINKSSVDLQVGGDTNTISETNLATMLSNLSDFINAVITDPENVIIAGDILKAFGSDARYTLPLINVDYVVSPIYDEAALTQIQNATLMGVATNTGTTTERLGVQTHTLTYTRDTSLVDPIDQNYKKNFINTYKNTMSPEETISYTRLSAFASTSASDGATASIITCGTEIIGSIFFANEEKQINGSIWPVGSNTNDIQGSAANTGAAVANFWSIMDYCPMIQVTFTQGNTSYASVLWDFNNFALVSQTDLENMHQIACLSLYSSNPKLMKQDVFKFV